MLIPPTPLNAWLRRPLAVWLAVLMALFGALARWVAPGPAQKAAPRTASSNHIPADSPDGLESALALKHCPFCLPSTDRAVPASRSFTFLVVAPGDPEEPTIWQAFFFLDHFALTPPPRGPPTIQTG